LAATVPPGTDGERITVANKQTVGEIIVNSDINRFVETNFCISLELEWDDAITITRHAGSECRGNTAPRPPRKSVSMTFSMAGW
jgi:hypothetical protein